MVCIQAAVLPAIAVLKLHGQVIVTNDGFKFHFLPLYASHGPVNDQRKMQQGGFSCFALLL